MEWEEERGRVADRSDFAVWDVKEFGRWVGYAVMRSLKGQRERSFLVGMFGM